MIHPQRLKFKKRWKKLAGLILLSILLIFILGTGGLSPASADIPGQDIPTVDPQLLTQSERSDSIDFLIYFEQQPDLSAAYEMDWEARGWYVYEALTAHADQVQNQVKDYLDDVGVTYTSFWAQNVIFVESSPSLILNGLLNFTEIETLQSIPQVVLVEPIVEPSVIQNTETRGAMSNLIRINADDVWAMGYSGEGMVVASIDTGVRYTHEALVGQYRGNNGGGAFNHNYNWWDAVNNRSYAYDDHSHGSHVTGIMVGTDGSGNQIGVAPEAEWIACKGIADSGSASGYDLIECGQFILAPWDLTGANPNPGMRPHVVNNSWGDCRTYYSSWYENTITAWLAAGIYPIFANGNASNCYYPSPPGLNTAGNPARSYHVTAVGSTGKDNGLYANHSNWGPTDSLDTLNPNGYPRIKPQVVAPGVSIRSAVATNNSAYQSWSGTSMSAPHVAGLVVLLWQAAPQYLGNYVSTETLMQNTAVSIPYSTGNGDEGPNNVPNHAMGWGEINVLAAVMRTQNFTLLERFYLPLFQK